MTDLAHNIAQLASPAGLPGPIRLAAAEVLTAAEKAGFHVSAVSWFNPDSTPEHHVPGFPGQGGVAVDFMVYGDQKVQNFVDGYVWDNRKRLGVCWLISRDRIRSTSPGRTGNWAEYTGSDPHTTHSHVNFGHLAGTSGEGKVTKVAYVPPSKASYTLVNANCQWPGFASTPKIPTWAHRRETLAEIFLSSGAKLLTLQEIGRVEAAQLAEALGPRWTWQRNLINAVFWDIDTWQITDPTTHDKSRDSTLHSLGYPGRTVLACRLVHKTTGQYLWAASTHLASTGGGLWTPTQAADSRHRQAAQLTQIFGGFQQIVMGADLNTRNTDADTLTEKILRDGGWTLDADKLTIGGLSTDAGRGIDAVLSKKRVTLTSVKVVPLGDASDHDGRLATFTITDRKAGTA